MDDLAREYWGHVKVARFMAKTRYFDVPSPEIIERYDIFYIPTVILFDKGIEVCRWRLVVMEDVYRYEEPRGERGKSGRVTGQPVAARAAPSFPGSRWNSP
jgi:hypothetical protein